MKYHLYYSLVAFDECLVMFVGFLQNPNALDSKVLLDFDHVKNSLKVDDEGMLQPISPSVAC